MVLAKQMVIGMAFYSFVALTQSPILKAWLLSMVYISFGEYSSSEEGNILIANTSSLSFLFPFFSLIFFCGTKSKN